MHGLSLCFQKLACYKHKRAFLEALQLYHHARGLSPAELRLVLAAYSGHSQHMQGPYTMYSFTLDESSSAHLETKNLDAVPCMWFGVLGL